MCVLGCDGGCMCVLHACECVGIFCPFVVPVKVGYLLLLLTLSYCLETRFLPELEANIFR